MKRNREGVFIVLTALFIFSFLTGCCRVRTYTQEKERVDQNLAQGNQGYLAGQSKEQPAERKMTRKTYVAEVELGRRYTAKSVPGSNAPGSAGDVVKEAMETPGVPEAGSAPAATAAAVAEMASYTVERNDTLQKISIKVYGTSKKWKKIFEANKDKIKTPDRIYAGQVLKIPQE